jgi:hypothetical protein
MINVTNGTNVNVRFGTIEFGHTFNFYGTVLSGQNRFVVQP